MDGLIHEHKSKQRTTRERAKHIQRSMGAAVDASRLLDFEQWREDPPEMVAQIESLKLRVRATHQPTNRRTKREHERLKYRLLVAEKRLGYWRWNKYNKAMPNSRRIWHQQYTD